MNFERIKKLSTKPDLYDKGTAEMWTDPYISEKLLELHINPDHDIASRSSAKVKLTTDLILEQAGKPNMHILDLGCGPGLYAEILAQKGHTVTGIDFSQNSIRYATQQAKQKQLNIQYLYKNYLELNFDGQFDLAIMIYLDFCALLPEDRDKVLQNVYRALKPGGLFICDVVNERNIEKKILPTSWDVERGGFWKSTPYIALNKGYHYPEVRVMANHHVVIGEDDMVDSYIFWSHYFSSDNLIPIFKSGGFGNIRFFDNVLPEADDFWNGENITFYIVRKE